MNAIRTVGIRELKNNLSAYLQDVRRGERILVTDRQRVIAELREPRAEYETAVKEHALLAEWIRTGVVRPALREKSPLPESPLKLPAGTAQRLLDAIREEGHCD